MDRTELLATIEAGKAELDAVLAGIPGDRMELPGQGRVWSPKDQLTHLAAWHQIVLCRMRGRNEEDVLDLPPKYADMDTDDVNRYLFERDRGRTPGEARDAFERTYRDVVATLESLSEDALHRTFRPDLPDRLLVDTIIGNTSGHYEEHVPMLGAAAASG